METQERFNGCLLGLATGDAVGTAVEFERRGSFAPVRGMQGGGPFGLKPGEWTDDTSMALCLATSLVEHGGFDAADQMEHYWRWYHNGYLSSTGRCFDIGMTVQDALERYHRTGEPFSGSTDPNKAGNGALMRLAPVVLYFFPDREKILHYAVESSRTTHGARECLEASRLLAEILLRALLGMGKRQVLLGSEPGEYATLGLRELAWGSYLDNVEEDIRGSGYVVRSLEAALWCFWKTSTFEDAILKAANLGDDADTTAAICGQVAGAFYKEKGIPQAWLDVLYMKDEIRELARKLRQG